MRGPFTFSGRVSDVKLKKALLGIETYFMVVLLLLATAVLFANVVLRSLSYGLSVAEGWFQPGGMVNSIQFLRTYIHSLPWAEELIRYCMIWISFFAAAACFRGGLHYGVDLLLRVKNKVFNRCLKVFIELCCAAFSAFLLIYGTQMVLFNMSSGSQVSPAMGIPTWFVYLIMPISGGLTMIYEIWRIIWLLRGRDVAGSDINTSDSDDSGIDGELGGVAE